MKVIGVAVGVLVILSLMVGWQIFRWRWPLRRLLHPDEQQMTLPQRIRERPTRPEGRLRSPAHLAWVRSHACCVPGCDDRPIEAAHVRRGTDGGTGMKPGDQWSISLCSVHHSIQHWIGEAGFEQSYGIDMKALAQKFAARSPKLRRGR